MNFFNLIKNTFHAVKKLYFYDKKFIAFTMLFSLLETLPAPIMSVLFWKWLFNLIEGKVSFSFVFSFLCAFAVLEFVIFLITSLYTDFYYSIAVLNIKSKIKLDFYNKIQKTDMIKYENSDFYSNYIAAGDKITECYLNIWSLLINIISSIFIVISISTLIISLEKFTLFFVIFNVLVTSISSMAKKRIAYNRYLETMEENKSLNYVNRVFYMKDYAKDIKCEQLPSLLIRKFEKAYNHLKKICVKYGVKNLKFDGPTIGLINISNYFMLSVIAFKILNGLILLGDFTALYNGSMQLTAQLKSIISTVPDLYEQNLYLSKIISFENAQSEIENDDEEVQNVLAQDYSIIFSNVFFSYPNKNNVLKDISVKINKGEKVAIVGENGSGKTTFLKLLLRLYDVNHGEILYNNINIKEININSYRKLFGNVFQDAKLYSFSIAENITLSDKKENTDRILNLLDSVGLKDKIQSLQEKISTQVGNEFNSSGINFSGGEQQKIAICRALYKNADILLFDEPNSALDARSEHELFQIINKTFVDKTIITVSHRLASTRDADKIIVFSDGQIVECGNHKELMQLKGLYFDLYEMQSSQYVEEY